MLEQGTTAATCMRLKAALRRFVMALAKRAVVPLVLTTAASFAYANAVASYYYDELGRLVEAVAADGSNVMYAYDAVGNITSVKHNAATAAGISGFVPLSGPVGTTVTIFGSGFNATAASNTVKFNGVSATVMLASPTTLTVRVPSGATTGLISVTNGAASATSAAGFTVASSGAPTISSFTPTIGGQGTSVTITGTNFQSTAATDKVMFADWEAAVSSVTPTTLITSDPAPASSGKISVTTPFGVATSVADFFSVPSGFNSADVQFTGRISLGGGPVIGSTNAANKTGLILFDGAVGAVGTYLQFTNIGTSGGTVSVFRPNGVLLVTGQISTSMLRLPPLPVKGTYVVMLVPNTPGSVSTSLQQAATVTIDGPSSSITSVGTGYGTVLIFQGTAGQNLGLALSALTLSGGSNGNLALNVYAPDGTQLPQYVWCSPGNPGGGCAMALPHLVSTGTYTIVVSNGGYPAITGGSLILSSDKTATLTSGADYSLSLRAGQNGRLSFSGTAGQPATIRYKSIVTMPADQKVAVTILKPDGSALTTTVTGSSPTNGTEVHVASLPSTGAYTVIVSPAFGVVTTLSMALNPAPELVVDGSPVNITTFATYGTSLTFNGVAGQNLGLGLSGLTMTGGAGANINVQVTGPDGMPLPQYVTWSTGNPGGDATLALANLPLTGPYLVTVSNAYTTGITAGAVTLSSDKTAALTSGAAYSLSLRGGQNGRLTFSGTAGQPATIRYKNIVTTPADQRVAVTILKPDGTPLTATVNGSSPTNGNDVYVASLPSTGTYTVIVSPAFGAVATLSMTLNPAPELVVDGSPVSITTPATYGTSLTFNGVAGQNLGLGLSGLTMTGGAGANINVQVTGPDGMPLPQYVTWSTGNPGGDATLALANLPLTGPYLVTVSNAYTTGITAGAVTLSSDKTAALTSGAAYSLSLRAGQNGRLTFSGTAGQPATIRYKNIVTTPADQRVAVTILKPDGTPLTATVNGSSPTNGNDVYVASLPSTGTYTVIVSPAFGAVTTLSMTLNPAPELVVDGSPVNITTPATYGTSLTFNGVAGQNLGLGLSGLTMTGGAGANINVQVTGPDGTQLPQNVIWSTGNPGGDATFALANLPLTGPYLVTVSNVYATGITAGAVTLSSDQTAALTSGAAYSLSLRAGQNGRLTFSGTAGQPATIRYKNIVTTPADQRVAVTILKPDGTPLTATVNGSSPTNGNDVYVASLPSTGTYTVIVSPAFGAVTTLSMTLNPAPELVVDGSPVNITTSATYGTSLTFNGVAGQSLGLGMSGLTMTSGSVANIYVQVTGPDGAQLPQSATWATGNPGGNASLALPNLALTGPYLIVVSNGYWMGITAGALTLSSDKIATLTPGAAYALSLRTGQNARLSFVGTAAVHTLTIGTPTTVPAGQSATVTVVDSGGNVVASSSYSSAGGTLALGTLSAGNYTVLVSASFGAPTSVTLTYQ